MIRAITSDLRKNIAVDVLLFGENHVNLGHMCLANAAAQPSAGQKKSAIDGSVAELLLLAGPVI